MKRAILERRRAPAMRDFYRGAMGIIAKMMKSARLLTRIAIFRQEVRFKANITEVHDMMTPYYRSTTCAI